MIKCDLVTVTIEAPGLTPVTLRGDYAEGRLNLASFDPGETTVRTVSEDRPHGDGSINTTRFFGARTITVGVSGDASAEDMIRFKRLCQSHIRSTITIEGDERISAPVVVARDCVATKLTTVSLDGDHELGIKRLVAQFEVPLGLFEGPTPTRQPVVPATATTTIGVTFNLVFPWKFGTGAVSNGDARIDVPGEARTAPILRFVGALDGPLLRNLTNGDTISAPPMVIPISEFVEVNTLTGTVRVNGGDGPSRLHQVDLTAGRPGGFRLEAGMNHLRFQAAAASPGAHCLVIAPPTYR